MGSQRVACVSKLALLFAMASGAVIALAASDYQLDVCGLHKSMNKGPTTTIEYDKERGMCTITSRMMKGGNTCPVGPYDGAMVLKFPCREDTSNMKITGPALNIWANYKATPAAASTAASRRADAAMGVCDVTTLSPPLYYHHLPPVYNYGYKVEGLPCQLMTSSTDSVNALNRGGSNYAVPSGNEAAALTYGIWLKPSLAGPTEKGFSTQAQMCRLAATVTTSTFLSLTEFPCTFTKLPLRELGKGCCYDPLSARHRRMLLGFTTPLLMQQ